MDKNNLVIDDSFIKNEIKEWNNLLLAIYNNEVDREKKKEIFFNFLERLAVYHEDDFNELVAEYIDCFLSSFERTPNKASKYLDTFGFLSDEMDEIRSKMDINEDIGEMGEWEEWRQIDYSQRIKDINF